MQSHWGPATPVAPVPGRLGRAGTLGLGGFVVWMTVGRVLLPPGTSRPTLVMVGWDMVLDALELRGHAIGAFRLALGGLWVAVPLWVVSGGFRGGPGWVPLASLAVGLTGLAAAVPLLVVVAVLTLNVILWGMAVMLGLLLLVLVLLRAVTAPFRRW
jgi:hypothetical protein